MTSMELVFICLSSFAGALLNITIENIKEKNKNKKSSR